MRTLKLTNSNYYSEKANQQFISVSQYKDFFGTLGYKGCEAQALAKLKGEYKEEPSTAMLVGSYIDSYFEGTLDDFKTNHPEIVKKDGTLKAEFKQAEDIIASIEPIINEKRLKKVLDSKYYVETTPIALNNLFLAFNEKENIKVLMGAKYANMTDLLYIFYYEDVFYCFDLLNADEEAGVDEDAYMFVCAFMRVQARDNTASHIWELFEKYKELKCEID